MCLCFLSVHTAVIQVVRSVAFQLLNLKLVKGNPSSRVSIVPGTRQKPFAFSAHVGEGYRGKRDQRIRGKREGLEGEGIEGGWGS